MVQEYYAARESAPSVAILPPLQGPSAADEANHRIANNLQLLNALISIEARRVADPAALASFAMMQRRIGAIAGVHRQLYSTRCAAATVDLGAYLADLAEDLEAAGADRDCGRQVLIEQVSVQVAAEEATSVGIIVSELVGNAWKYAYAPGAPGFVCIILRAMPLGGYWLEVSDHGSGLRPGAEPRGTGVGSQLIAVMARRLNAAHAWQDNAPGTRFTLCTGAA